MKCIPTVGIKDNLQPYWTCNRYCSGAKLNINTEKCYYAGCRGRKPISVKTIELYVLEELKKRMPEEFVKHTNEEGNNNEPISEDCIGNDKVINITKEPLNNDENVDPLQDEKNTTVCKSETCSNRFKSDKKLYCSVKCRKRQNTRDYRKRLMTKK